MTKPSSQSRKPRPRVLPIALGALWTFAAMGVAVADSNSEFTVQLSDGTADGATRHQVRCDLDRLPCVQVLNGGKPGAARPEFTLLHILPTEGSPGRVTVIVSLPSETLPAIQQKAVYSQDQLAAGLFIRVTRATDRGRDVQLAIETAAAR